MKMRLTTPMAAPGAWRVAGRSAAGAVLLAVTVSACTGGGSGSSVPSIFTPTPQTSGQSSQGTRTPSPSGGSSRSAGGSSASTSTSRGSASASGTPHTSASSHASSSAHATGTAAATGTATATPTPGVTTILPTHTPTPTQTAATVSPQFPTAAPETGGGGTAGLQDGLLFGAGGAAVLVGLGTLAYRRRLARKFGIREHARRGPSDRGPADREPVDR